MRKKKGIVGKIDESILDFQNMHPGLRFPLHTKVPRKQMNPAGIDPIIRISLFAEDGLLRQRVEDLNLIINASPASHELVDPTGKWDAPLWGHTFSEPVRSSREGEETPA